MDTAGEGIQRATSIGIYRNYILHRTQAKNGRYRAEQGMAG